LESFFNRNTQAVLISVVLVGGVATSAFGLSNFKKSIGAPFADREIVENLNIPSVAQIDTDKDGLLDADEVAIYGTSPFLPDSDSDGINDDKEIEQGKNPNCPEGKTCALISTPGQLPAPNSATDSPVALNNSGGSVSVAELRQQLIAGGVPKEALDSLTDEELLAAYAAAASEATAGGGQTNSVAPATPAQIRELLKKAGMTDEQLAGLTDAQLLEAYNKTKQEIEQPAP
jgi:hypothetical protein